MKVLSKRFTWLTLIFCSIIFLYTCRLAYLQMIRHDDFVARSQDQLQRLIKLYPNRGNIYARDLSPLALTMPSFSLYALPEKIANKWDFCQTLSPHLGIPRQTLLHKFNETRAPFVWIERQLSKSTMESIKNENLEGIGFIKTEKRVYPRHQLASSTLGFVGIDNQGLGGLEYLYDADLKGSEGKIILEGDPRGRQLITGFRKTFLPHDGNHIVTTLDPFIQYSAEKHLEEGVSLNQALKGQIVVMNPKNGDILALASYPSFDPNDWQTSNRSHRKNGAINDVFEPGSIFKLITVASALEEGLVAPQTALYVPEELPFKGTVISEAHKRHPDDPDTYTVSEIIERSLNVGTTLLATKLGEERFYSYMTRFGFGSRTGVELPGESPGLLRAPKNWSGVDIAMMSFGQGVAITSLQMAAAVSALVNDGIYHKPRLVYFTANHDFSTRKTTPIHAKRVISSRTSEQLKTIMQRVVQYGTGTTTQIPGYSIGGKTGTAQKAKENGLGYEKGSYVASFVGFFPVDDPLYVIMVMVDTPKKTIWGSTVAGPIFKHIAEDIIRQKNIPPDKFRYALQTTESSRKIQ